MEKELCKSPHGVLLKDGIWRKYFSGIEVAEGYLLLSETPVYFTDSRYFYAAKDKIKDSFSAKLFTGLDSVKAELEKQGIKKLYIDFDTTTLTENEEYKSFGVELLNGSDKLKSFREIKSVTETENIKKACETIQKAYYETLKTVKEGITEKEVKDVLDGYAIRFGAEGPAFDTIVAFGENSAVPHHETGDRKLKDGDVILVDTGCKVNGYCSDLTRTCFFGTPSEKFLEVYNSVLNANLIAEEKIILGMTLKDCDGIAREYLKERGFDKFFTHSLGHGVGLEIHEEPYLSPKRSGEIKEGNVFTVEPGVYFDGEFGVRIEDTVVLKNGKVERLFTDDKKLMIL